MKVFILFLMTICNAAYPIYSLDYITSDKNVISNILGPLSRKFTKVYLFKITQNDNTDLSAYVLYTKEPTKEIKYNESASDIIENNKLQEIIEDSLATFDDSLKTKYQYYSVKDKREAIQLARSLWSKRLTKHPKKSSDIYFQNSLQSKR